MAFAITANFLLGTYQGSDSGGRPEPYPSPDRLYKACVAAAYNTFDFERQTDDRVLTDEQIESGGWEALIDRTNQRYGFWGVSYMEALLRAADITCSKEGL